MALNINNEYCTSFEQLRSYFITLPEFGSNLYWDLIESGRDQAISQWLHDNIGNVDMAHQLESIDDDLGDTDYLKEMRRIILGEKVLEDDSVQVVKPSFLSCFSLENIELEQTNEMNTVLISLKVLTPMVNENFELRLETGWGIQSWSINPFNSKVDEVLTHDFGFCKLFDQEFDCIRLYADNELLSEVSVQRRNRMTTIHGIKQDEPSMASYKKNPSSSFRYEFGMFKNSSLEEIDLSNLDTSKVANMGYMFRGCSSLKVLDLSSFDTSEVTTMDSMFHGCSSLKVLDLSSFDTSMVANMGYMFHGCSSLKALDLSSFDTSEVTTMDSMFEGCSSLKALDLSSFDTSKVTTMDSMFEGCSSLKALDLSGFDLSEFNVLSRMFYGCSSLEELDLSCLHTLGCWSLFIDDIFSGCVNLRKLVIKGASDYIVSDIENELLFSGLRNVEIVQ